MRYYPGSGEPEGVMKDVLLVCPQERDLRAIREAGLDTRYRIHTLGADLDVSDSLDVEALLAAAEALPLDGVLATKDRSALLAALIARRCGLPGPTPQAMLNCQYKPISRALQRAVAPKATPRFALLDGGVPFRVPFFVKPVVGRLSQNARRIDEPLDLLALADPDAYAERYARVATHAGLDPDAARGYLAEELLYGDEVTLEGYVKDGRVTVIGTTDSVKYPGSNSFERFEYPTMLSPERQAELREIVERVLPALSFDGGFFNVELFVPVLGPARIIEVNGRLSSQFDPLYRAVHGRSNYEAALALACGDEPGWDAGAPDGVAISYCVRVFENAFVDAVPDREDGLEILAEPGRALSEQGTNDAQSFRLCIFSESAPTREEAVARCRARAARLRERFTLRPVATAVPA
jgi:hypothetical protein